MYWSTDPTASGWTEGGGLVRADVRFTDEAAVRGLAQRLAALAGRRLDDASPYVDAALPDGTRLHAVLPPVASAGTCLSLRTFMARAFTIDDLEDAGTLCNGAELLLRAIVRSRAAFLVSGGTGSGKTTLLASMLGLVQPAERLILVEDAAELRPAHPHVVRLTARPPNVEGAGEVSLRDLVRQALRMRPDRLVVGEVRGAEVVELLTALNTGHAGSGGTLHANSAAQVPARLEALGALGALDRHAVCSQVAAALQVAIHLDRLAGREPGAHRDRRLPESAATRWSSFRRGGTTPARSPVGTCSPRSSGRTSSGASDDRRSGRALAVGGRARAPPLAWPPLGCGRCRGVLPALPLPPA